MGNEERLRETEKRRGDRGGGWKHDGRGRRHIILDCRDEVSGNKSSWKQDGSWYCVDPCGLGDPAR